MYTKLVEFERTLDATVLRKRIELEESMRKPAQVNKLRRSQHVRKTSLSLVRRERRNSESGFTAPLQQDLM